MGNLETLVANCWGGDPCVAGLGAVLSPMVTSAYGNFPGGGEEKDRQRVLTSALRRLVLRGPSAFGRRKWGRRPGFPWVYWAFGICFQVLITRRS